MSSNHEGNDVNLHALLNGNLDSGVENGEELIRLSEALVEGDPKKIASSSANVISLMGAEALVDVIGVYSNFERMVRIADATGVELGDTLNELSADIRNDPRVERPADW